MNAHPNIRLELTSNPLYLSGVREFIAGVAKRLGFTEMHCSQIALAVDEALCNVIRHGYDSDVDRPIWVMLTHAGDGPSGLRLEIVIEDEARQVEPCDIKGRALDDIRPGGLGVHIIREVMDQAVYEKRHGAGMRLTLVKVQAPTAVPAANSGCGKGRAHG